MLTVLAELLQRLSARPLFSFSDGLVVAVAFGVAILLANEFASFLRGRKRRQHWHRRIGIQSDRERTVPSAPLWRMLIVLGERTRPRNPEELSSIRRTLVQAGYRRADAPIILFGVKLCLAIVLPLLLGGLYLPALQPLPVVYTMLILMLLAVTGFYAPSVWLRMRTQRRRRRITEGFPDALDLTVVCVEAGMGLDAAIHRVGEQIVLNHKALGAEFKLVDLGLRAGQARQDALKALAERTGLDDIQSFVTLLIQTERFGTSVGAALRVHADAMRTKRQQQAEVTAAKLPVKLLFPLIFCIFPSLFVVIVGPAGIQIIRALSAVGTP